MFTNISIILLSLAVLITNFALIRTKDRLKDIDQDLWLRDLYIKDLQNTVIDHDKQIKELKKKLNKEK